MKLLIPLPAVWLSYSQGEMKKGFDLGPQPNVPPPGLLPLREILDRLLTVAALDIQ